MEHYLFYYQFNMFWLLTIFSNVMFTVHTFSAQLNLISLYIVLPSPWDANTKSWTRCLCCVWKSPTSTRRRGRCPGKYVQADMWSCVSLGYCVSFWYSTLMFGVIPNLYRLLMNNEQTLKMKFSFRVICEAYLAGHILE